MSDAPLLKRRTLMGRLALGGVALGLGGLTVGQSVGYAVPQGVPPLVLSAKEWTVLEAVCARFLAGLDGDAPRDAAVFIDGWLARQRPRQPWIVDEVRGLLHLFEASPPWFTWKLSRFTRLPVGQQDRYIRAWQVSSNPLVKQGYQGLKGLAMMGGWRRPASFGACGYDGPLSR